MESMKKCKICNINKELSEYYSRKNKRKNGEEYIYYNPVCKECYKQRDKQRYIKNKEKYIQQVRQYYKSNINQVKEKQKQYRKKTIEKRKEYDKIYREKNAEIISKKRRKFYQENSDRVKEQRKNYPQLKEYDKKYRQENAERIKEQQKRYLQTERGKEVIFKKVMKRKSYKQKVSFTPIQRKEILDRDNWTCQICGIKVHDRSTGDWNTPDKAHVDHIIPISKGGNSEPSNLQILCRTCNTSKQDKDNLQFKI